MGYAGYYSTTAQIKDKPTELQTLLSLVDSMEALTLLEKLSYNIAVAPTEQKYRKIKLSNPKIKANVVDVPQSRAVLIHLGWEPVTEDGEDYLVLSTAKHLSMAPVRDIQAAQRELQKKSLKRNASTASLSSNPDQQRLRDQIEADRRERAAAQAQA